MMHATLRLFVAAILAISLGAAASAQNVLSTETTLTARVDAINRSTRTLTLRREGNITRMVAVDPAEKLFDELKVGDRITVRYIDSTIVEVRPQAPLSRARDTTDEAQAGNDQVLQQQKLVVTIEDIDPDGQFVVYRSKDGTRGRRWVADRKLLQGIRKGDTVEVTLTRERAVSIERAGR
jgi:hypothetical protein